MFLVYLVIGALQMFFDDDDDKSLSYTRKNCIMATFHVYWVRLSTHQWKVSRSSISTGLKFPPSI